MLYLNNYKTSSLQAPIQNIPIFVPQPSRRKEDLWGPFLDKQRKRQELSKECTEPRTSTPGEERQCGGRDLV